MSAFYSVACDFLSANFPELSPKGFYREIFPEGALQKKGVENFNDGKYNAIACEIFSSGKVHRFSVTDELSALDELLKSENFVILAPLSYAGKARTSVNARDMYALCFDLDGVDDRQHLADLFFQARNGVIPLPTFTAVSGNGLHLYYQLDLPVTLYPNVAKQLDGLKHALTRLLWNRYLTYLCDAEKVQYQPVNQPFRLVGGVTKDFQKTGNRVRVWRTSNHPTTLEELNEFVDEKHRVSDTWYKSTYSLDEAKEKFPGWYERKILGKGKKRSWTCKRALYDWWLRQIRSGATVGHRYYCVMCLAIYARKAGVEFDELKKDAFALLPIFDEMSSDEQNHFTRADIKDALTAYKDDFKTFPINSISYLSAIPIQKNKRNGRTQKQHLEGARAIQAIQDKYNGTNWREGNGRKSQFKTVLEYLRKNPEARKAEVIRATGLSKMTVYKHYDKAREKLGFNKNCFF